MWRRPCRTLRALPPEIKTIAYVDPVAYSAGTIFALACNEIVMSPGARLGDCAPIMLSGEGLQPLPAAERAKVVSPLVTEVRAAATQNGYDAGLLEALLIPERTIVALVNDAGVKRFVAQDKLAEAKAEGFKPIPGVHDPLDAADTLLTVDDQTAAAIGLSKATYANVDALLSSRSLSLTARYSPTAGQKIIQWLNSDAIRGLLITIFMISMYLSFNVPGHGLPEAVCLTALATLLLVPLLTGYASWLEILMILGGIALLALEVFVFTGTLLPGIIGAVLILMGFVLTFVPREFPTVPGEYSLPSLPSLPATWHALQNGAFTVSLAIILAAITAVVLSRYLPHLPYAGRLVLTATTAKGGAGSVLTPGTEQPWPPLGATAVSSTDLRPSGHAEFPNPDGPGTLTLPVVSDSGYLPKGTAVRVTHLEGPRILVRPLPTTV